MKQLRNCVLIITALFLPLPATAGNLVGRYATVPLNGSVSPWQPSDVMYTASDISQGIPLNSTFTNVYVANDSNYIYIALQPPAPVSIDSNWTYTIYLDTDMNSKTGYNGGWMTGGYDRVISFGASGTEYSIAHFAGGTNQASWDWIPGPTILYATSTNNDDPLIELAIPFSSLGLTSNKMRMEFYVGGGDVTQNTWAAAEEANVGTYTLATPPPTSLPSTNALLLGLSISTGPLSPAFDSNALNYTATNVYSSEAVRLTAICANSNATLQLSFNGGTYCPLPSGAPSRMETLSLNPQINTFDVLVTAQDGYTKKLYRVNVINPSTVFASGATNSWLVFEPLALAAKLGTNMVLNPGMESVQNSSSTPLFADWNAYGAGYSISTDSHSGALSLACTATSDNETHGAWQTIELNQTTPQAIKLSGWSKALDVTGVRDNNYSVWLDISYEDDPVLYTQVIPFAVGSHDWQYDQLYIIPSKPIKSINCYMLLRGAHTGTVWFDDVSVAQVQNNALTFDGSPVVSTPPYILPFNPANQFVLQGGDVKLQLTQEGGVIDGISQDSNDLMASGSDYASGWLVCDRNTDSGWWNVGGVVKSTNGILMQDAVITNLNLAAEVRYSVTNDAIRIQAAVYNLVASNRAITLYFALPADMDEGYWWNSPRDKVSVTDALESATLVSGFGARNLLSAYPLATVANTNGALTLAIPPGQYRPFRLIYNRVSRLFYAAFDLGLSSIPSNFRQVATVDVWLYGSDPHWGMRSGLAGYYHRFSSSFANGFTNEGIWANGDDIDNISNVSDFGIYFNELGGVGVSPNTSDLMFDNQNNIAGFRYHEPFSYWMNMPTNIPNTIYSQVYNYLVSQSEVGVALATATLSSGLLDSNGLYQFYPAAEPWCPYGALFLNNASPYITNSQYAATKFSFEWNSSDLDEYQAVNGVLGGEFFDSFDGYSTTGDYSSNHMSSSSFPLAYTANNTTLMTPLIYGTYEMARTITAQVHALGGETIANFAFDWPSDSLPIAIGLFDFTGTELNCFDNEGDFEPISDTQMLYARSMSGVRPYGIMLNTDLTKLTESGVESYMRLCGVYGIYPCFGGDTSGTDPYGFYFSDPGLYNRDRPLFKKYIPIIRAMNLAGWSPITDATVDNTNVAIESFGSNATTGVRYLSVRNMASDAETANVTFNVSKWASPGAQTLELTNLYDGGSLAINLAAGSNSMALSLESNECTVYATVAMASTNALLSDLTLSTGGLVPAFTSGVDNYAATNYLPTNYVTVTATSVDSNAKLQLSINGGSYIPITNGVPSGPQLLSQHLLPNRLAILVTAANAITTNVYTVGVWLGPSQTVPQLRSTVSNNVLTLAWSADHIGYRLEMQTNNLNKGLSGNPNDWSTVTGSTTNDAQTITLDKMTHDEFYRLVYP